MNFTNEQITQIDSNNTKARAILEAVVKLYEEQSEGIDFMSMVEGALYFLKSNETMFGK